MRTPLVAGNWKMHKTLAEARELVDGIRKGVEGVDGVDVLICPPAHLLLPMMRAVVDSPIMVGAQNVHEEQKGAFTGEISVPMLVDARCSHVIVGHSERRHVFGEQGPRLAKKVLAVLGAPSLTAIYCVGETLDEREAGKTESVLEQQLDDVIGSDVAIDRIVVAYEPVWAIGTGKTASPEQAQQAHAFIRSKVSDVYGPAKADDLRILYGGSVKPDNAGILMEQKDVDGALVGGACLVAEDFVAIIRAGVSA